MELIIILEHGVLCFMARQQSPTCLMLAIEQALVIHTFVRWCNMLAQTMTALSFRALLVASIFMRLFATSNNAHYYKTRTHHIMAHCQQPMMHCNAICDKQRAPHFNDVHMWYADMCRHSPHSTVRRLFSIFRVCVCVYVRKCSVSKLWWWLWCDLILCHIVCGLECVNALHTYMRLIFLFTNEILWNIKQRFLSLCQWCCLWCFSVSHNWTEIIKTRSCIILFYFVGSKFNDTNVSRDVCHF